MSTTPWFSGRRPNPQARLRLFCFPYAGGSASLFRLWGQQLPPQIEVCPVQLPGRENRLREAPLTAVHDVVQALCDLLPPYLDKPFAFFGHSMGTLIAYELAHALWRRTGLTPTHLLVSGRRAPSLPEPERLLHTLPTDAEFLDELQRRYQNLPAVLFSDAELREIFVPLLRADFTLVESYQWQARARLPCPIVALGGDADNRATEADLRAWQELTQAAFALHLFPGGHFYLNEQSKALLALIAEHLVI